MAIIILLSNGLLIILLTVDMIDYNDFKDILKETIKLFLLKLFLFLKKTLKNDII